MLKVIQKLDAYEKSLCLLQFRSDLGEVGLLAKEIENDPEFDFKKIEVISVNSHRSESVLAYLSMQSEISKRMDWFRLFDTVFFDQLYPFNNHLFKKTSIKQVFMVHGPCSFLNQTINFRHPRNSLEKIWQRVHMHRLFKAAFNGNDQLLPLFNSFYTFEKVRSQYQIASLTLKDNVIFFPFDTEVVTFQDSARRQMRSELNIGEGEIVIAMIANFNSEMKRAWIIPELHAKLEKIANLRFLFIGKGGDEYSRGFDEWAHNTVNVIRIEQIQHSEALKFNSVADFVFSLSEKDTFGYSIVEAMSCGRPVFVADRGAHQEHVTSGVSGFVCKDIDEMGVKMGSLATAGMTKIEKMGRQARKQVESSYGIDAFAAKLEQLLA